MKKLFCMIIGLLLVLAVLAQDLSIAEDYTLNYFKKLNKTQDKLTYMHKKSSLAKVGTETVNGDISGTLFYDVKIKGMGAVVTLRYTNYCDEEGWTFDGEILTYSNMAQNGYFEGTSKITGIAPGEVCYDKVIMKKGAPGEGFYLVSFSGKTAVPVDYSMYQKSKE